MLQYAYSPRLFMLNCIFRDAMYRFQFLVVIVYNLEARLNAFTSAFLLKRERKFRLNFLSLLMRVERDLHFEFLCRRVY